MSPALQGPSGPLTFHGAPSDGGYLLTGRRATVEGHARVGVASVVGPLGEMIRDLRVEPGACRRFSHSPGSLLREIEVQGGVLREVILVPRDFPGAALQWSWAPTEGGAGSLDLTLTWQPGEGLAPDSEPPEGALVHLRDPDVDRGVTVTMSDAESKWSVHRQGEAMLLRTTLVQGTTATLLVAEGPEGESPFRLLPGWERTRAGQDAQAEEELLGVHVEGTELDQGVAWARARLESPILDRPSSDAGWLGLAALCAGRFDLARQTLRRLEEAQPRALLDEQVVLWTGSRGRGSPEAPRGIPVLNGPPPRVLTVGALAARARPVQLARALCTLVAGTLGARPDAGFGRLRLSPQLPSHWHDLRMRNLRMGDVRVSLAYRREGRLHTFTVRQTGGAVPANLVFEPLVAEAELSSVLVDGEAAELDLLRRGAWVGTRVQLPLDPERRVVLEGRGDG